ncbi:tyrosine-type recombinase/integrase [Candidatus Vampirococcus lugosii]|uniref:Integrase n=1 Tax=Candidatus Vampirococcus lugosii TaxID=2789015 RepID=A0ABS5QMQ7_9BACT|nr:site-specific integrase [Candidatus Vampirococcus lugosii]MBS8122452.1 Integrase [Candidatus Vampirococcus lugosii]
MVDSDIKIFSDNIGSINPKHPAFNLLEMEIWELIEKFLRTKKSIRTQQSYFTDLKFFFEKYEIYDCKKLLNYYSNYELSDMINDYINSSKKVDPQDPNRIYNPRTVNRKAYSLSSFFKFLQKRYKLNYNPVMFDALNTPKYSSTNSINNEELKNILNFLKQKYENENNKIKNLRNYLIFCFFSFSLRRNEVSKLRWQDINKSEKYIQVLQKGNTTKLIPIPSNVYELLLEFQTLKASLGYIGDYIFTPFNNNKTKTINKPISPDYLYNLVIKLWNEFETNTQIQNIYQKINKLQNKKKYLNKKLKLNKNIEIEEKINNINYEINNLKNMKKEILKNNKQISCHSFRKTFVEQAILRGDDFVQIQNATGHTNPNMINYYQTINKTKHNSINNLDNFY